jgi:hypothetical protein
LIAASGAETRLRLPQVTLVAVTSVALDATLNALVRSTREVRFASTLLLTDRPPGATAPEAIEWRRIDAIRSRTDYSRFMLHSLSDHVQTSHALCVQWDGFVADPGGWDDRFLEYDYIGAPWPHFTDGHNVGNGGFSLRSKRLLEACRELPFDGSRAEDVVICRLYRDQLDRMGMRFAPEELARRFAYERTAPAGGEFGFHGVFNLVQHLSEAEVLALLRTIEPSVLSRNEHVELLRWALSRGYGRHASAILLRLLRRQLSRR